VTPPQRRSAHNHPSLGALFTVLAMIGFASMDAISKWIVADYAIGQMMWIRYAVFCVFAWLVVRRRGGLVRAARSRRPWLQASRALLAVIESAVFGERVGTARWLAVAVGLAGVLMIVRPGFRTLDWPLLLPLLGALLWAGYQVMVRLCARDDSPETTLVWSAFAAFAAASFVGPWQWLWPDALGWTLMIAMAVLGSLAHFALIKALDYAEAGAVQPYSYTLLVWVTVLGALVFGDIPDHWTLLGAAVIVASGLYTWHHGRQAEKRAIFSDA
jgi:drug/metabolite transporter (DMT)-like permease